MGKTSIEWTNYSFNHVWGCTKVAAGCTNCYAEAFSKRTGRAKWGDSGTRVKTSESYWKQPIKWNRDAEAAGERRRVFCASMADVFEDWNGPIIGHKGAPLVINVSGFTFHVREDWTPCYGERGVTLDDVRGELFRLIDATPHLDWLVLTKRPENIRRMWKMVIDPLLPDIDPGEWWRQNCWLGTSIATRDDADRNIPLLREARSLAPVLFLSIEPLLEDLGQLDLSGIGWVIAGGESGHGARPCHPDWVRSIRDQCKASGVAFFFKQWGEWKPIGEMTEAENEALYVSRKQAGPHQDQVALDECYGRRCLVDTHSLQFDGKPGHRSDCIPGRQVPSHQVFRLGKKVAGRLLDGVEHSEFPKVKAAQ